MQSFSDDRRNYTPLLDQLGLYFQIRDDLINLSSPEYMKGKSFCEDLTVGVIAVLHTFCTLNGLLVAILECASLVRGSKVGSWQALF